MPELVTSHESSQPTRTCVGCGGRDRQEALVRLQFDGDSTLHIVTIPGHGRSAYIHASASCRTRLGKSRLLAKSLRRAISEDHKQQVDLALQAHMAHSANLHTAPTSGHETAGA